MRGSAARRGMLWLEVGGQVVDVDFPVLSILDQILGPIGDRSFVEAGVRLHEERFFVIGDFDDFAGFRTIDLDDITKLISA